MGNPFENNPKNLDPFYKTDLEVLDFYKTNLNFWIVLEKINPFDS